MTSDKRTPAAQYSAKRIVIVGSSRLIPEDILEEGLLTPCDQREIALDHITRTSDVVFHLQFVKTW